MKVILLAAGRGSRLGERTKDRPKCLVEVCGKTILSRCMETLEQAGLSHSQIGIVTGYRKELIELPGVSYFHNEDWETTNMVSSLLKAKSWLEQDTCLVCYSDIIFSPRAIQVLQETEAPLAITYYTRFWELWKARMADPLSDLETFRINSEGLLQEIGKKPSDPSEVMGQYMGLIRFTPESWRWAVETMKTHLTKPVERLDMTTLLQGILEQKYPIQAIATGDLWLECDTQQDIELYESMYREELGGESHRGQ